MELGNILRTQIKNSVNNCSMKFSLPLLPPLPPPSSFPSPSLLKETNKQKVQVEFKVRGPDQETLAAVLPQPSVFLQLHLPSHLSRPLLTPASVLSGRESFQILAESILFSTVTARREIGWSPCHRFALLLSSLRSPDGGGGGEACKEPHSAAAC